MKFCLISLQGTSSKQIAEEAKKYFDEVEHLDLKNIEIRAEKSLEVLYQGNPIKKYDCVYIRGSYEYSLLQRAIARALHNECYMPLEPRTFTIGHNKLLTMLEMQKKQVPIPKTCFAATSSEAKKTLKILKFPVIIKIPEGTHGKGVMFADSIESAKSFIDALEAFKQPYIIQEYIETNSTDLRVIVIGDRVAGAMRRKATLDEKRANLHAGGSGKPAKLDYETEQAAIRAAKAVGAEICAIDILESGKPYVIEINLSPGLKISGIIKKNIAHEIVKFLAERTKEFTRQKLSAETAKIISNAEAESKSSQAREFITTLDIKAGIIKLPKIVTHISRFNLDDEVVISSEKGKIIIKKHAVAKQELE